MSGALAGGSEPQPPGRRVRPTGGGGCHYHAIKQPLRKPRARTQEPDPSLGPTCMSAVAAAIPSRAPGLGGRDHQCHHDHDHHDDHGGSVSQATQLASSGLPVMLRVRFSPAPSLLYQFVQTRRDDATVTQAASEFHCHGWPASASHRDGHCDSESLPVTVCQ